MNVANGGLETPPPRTVAGRALRRLLGERGAAARWEAQSRLEYMLRHGESRRRLQALHDRHRGQRCFIIGNGPSLKETNLGLLRDEFTFGLNRIYLAFEELGFKTSCLVSINRLVLEQSARELGSVPIPKFFGTQAARYISADAEDVTYLRSTARPGFSRDPVRNGVWEGATVTFVALQLAHWFGFTRVVLVGVDHSFSVKGPAHQVVTSEGPDADHFHPDYFGAGYRWQLPDYETSEFAYQTARDAFEADGREVLDATVGGKLTIFPKATLEDLL